MAEKMNQSDLFMYWLAGELDSDRAASVEVEDKAGGEVLGEFTVSQSISTPMDHGVEQVYRVQFEDGSEVSLAVRKHS